MAATMPNDPKAMLQEVKLAKHHLLIGAGFSKHFGGFLGEEMWSIILNSPDVQHSDRLRSVLLENYDFEAVYTNVMDDQLIGNEEKQKFRSAVYDAYRVLDGALLPNVPVDWKNRGLGTLLEMFWPSERGRPLIFSLNQDILLERLCSWNTPGVSDFPKEIREQWPRKELGRQDYVSVARDEAVERAPADLRNREDAVLVKLHGSYGWKLGDDPTQIVIGTNKEGIIGADPLLSWYHKLFKATIELGEQKLLVIGYGFRDTHINQVLLDGVSKHGLKLYVLNVVGPSQLTQQIAAGHFYATPILKGVYGYFPFPFGEVFHDLYQETVHSKSLKASLID